MNSEDITCTAKVLHRNGDITECGLPCVTKRRKLCVGHLGRLYRKTSSDPGPPIRQQRSIPKTCFCGEPVHGRGYCAVHYQRFLRNGTTDRLHMENVGKTCIGFNKEECNNPAKRRGFCESCYKAANAERHRALAEIAEESACL